MNKIGTKKQRLARIGGSEFATVLGVNPYKKRIELVLEKAGVLVDTFEGNEATRRGQTLENDIIAIFEEKTGLEVTEEQKECAYTPKTIKMLPLVCHLDGLTSDNAVFEAKTTDLKSKTWKDGIPEYYKAQLDFNCALSGKRLAYIAVGYCDGCEIVKFDYFQYQQQMELDEIAEVCKAFSDDVEKYKTLGVVNNGLWLETKFSNELIEELENINEQITPLKIQLKPLEDRKKYIEDKIKKEIGNNYGFETDLFRVTLGNRITSPSPEYKVSRSGIKIEYKR